MIHETQKPTKTTAAAKWLVMAVIAALLGAVTVGIWQYKDMSDPPDSAKPKVQSLAQTDEGLAQYKRKQAEMADRINAIIQSNPGVSFSVAVINQETSDMSLFGRREPSRAASSAKLISAAMFLRQTEIGKAALTETFGDQTALSLIRQLINKSDQAAWDLLRDRLGRPAIKAYAHSLGLSSYDTENEVITASDMAQFLSKLYGGELLSKANSQRLLSFMRNTNYEQYIPPAVPVGYPVYHKVGFIETYLNDAAIIVGDHGAVVLVIFTHTTGLRDWPGRAEDMQAITKPVIRAYLET